ncbi:MAG TPA: glycolate oxidase subunit GlcE [Paenalcaligenes sp.]|nr:glycolate oxidase subunit GlcE [Paenalcaligenes sp.]
MNQHQSRQSAQAQDALLDEWSAKVTEAQAQRTPLILQGAGSKEFYGHPPAGQVLDVSGYRGVVDYEPSELVITARGGTPVAEIEALLAEQGQFLAFEPPLYSPQSTLAGCVAAGLAGPRRAQAGGVRDFMLGVKIIDGQGRLLTFGGQVMKNVAGYDVSRLMAGSLGTLGIITELSIKVLPLPIQEQTLVLAMDQPTALQKLNEWAGQPLPISASLWVGGQLHLRLSGAPSALAVAHELIGGEQLPDEQATALWTAVRHQQHSWFMQAQGVVAEDPEAVLWRLSLPSVAPMCLPDEPQLIEWGGALRWCVSSLPAADIRAAVAALGGTATAFRGQQVPAAVFHPLEPAVLTLQKRLKQKFDPAGIFNPGKIYPGEL